MKSFRLFLIVVFCINLFYTTNTVIAHGLNLFPIFFGDILSGSWAGQFNLDFMSHLILSGVWVSYRNNFSVNGLLLGICALVGGILFLTPYLFYLSFNSNDSIKTILTGK